MLYESSDNIIKNTNGSVAELKRTTIDLYYHSMVKTLNRHLSNNILCDNKSKELNIKVRTLISGFLDNVSPFHLKSVSPLQTSFVAYRGSLSDALERLEVKLKEAGYGVRFEYSGDASYDSYVNEGKFIINF